ncbi:MAG: hypothetical protein HY784_18260 [Chloroflexi bacterium]|nr:hypothetical protein [Chloroflexota bacterium]
MIDLLGLILVLFCAVLMLGFWLWNRTRRTPPVFRHIESFSSLPEDVGLAVEAGKRLHISLGSGGLTGPESAAAYAGLAVLARIAEVTTISDKPPVVTAGDGATAILAQDTLRAAYDRQHADKRYEHTAGRMAGATPLSYAAGAMAVTTEEEASLNVLAGSFHDEGALIAHAGMAGSAHVLAGSDSVPAQAMLYAVANNPLRGEELYADGAYMNAGPMHTASLQAQDVLRWLIVALLLLGLLLRLARLDTVLQLLGLTWP